MDRPALVAFMARLQDHERTIEPNRAPGDEIADRHLAVLEAWAGEGGGILVAEEAGVARGFAVWGLVEEDGFHVAPANRRYGAISDLWVEPGARGAGIGAALIETVEQRLRTVGIGRIELTALAANGDAIRLYRRLGYGPYELTLAKAL